MRAGNNNALTIESYIATNNPKESVRILREFGAPATKAGDYKDLLNKLHLATDKFGMRALEKMASIETPYRSLILTEYAKNHTEEKSNCGGCSHADGMDDDLENIPTKSVVNTSANPTQIAAPTNHHHQILIGVGLALIAVIAIKTIAK